MLCSSGASAWRGSARRIWLTVTLALGLLLASPGITSTWAAAYYVDPAQGSDENDGAQASPFRTINAAVTHLQPGDTLWLNEGVYLERVEISSLKGTQDAPIIISGREGAHVEIYDGLPYFRQPGNDQWERVTNGAADEWRSTMKLPSSGYHGQFLDTNIRLARYSEVNDFRASNELWARNLPMYDTRPGPEATDRQGEPQGVREGWTYYGPGLRYNLDTQRLHIRLSHTTIAQSVKPYYQGNDDPRRYLKPREIARQTEINDYTGPTDPRKLGFAIAANPITISLRFSSHIEFRNLTIRNSLSLKRNQHITFRDVIFYPTKSWGYFGGDSHVRFLHCEFNGGMPPWHFRSEYKGPYYYRTPDGQIVRNNRVRYTNRTLFVNYGVKDMEIAYCEFRNAHDLYLAGVNTEFHHNLVEDIHDDALFISHPDEIENMHVHHNVFRRVMMGMAFHGDRAGISRFVYRNIFDMREPARSSRPSRKSDHGHWAWRSLFIAKTGQIGPLAAYQNTFLVRNNFTITGGLKFPNAQRPRQLYNNLFISLNPSISLIRPIPTDYPAQVDGNLWWRHNDAGTSLISGFTDLNAYRTSEQFEQSKQWYSPGWHAHDLHADPQFKRFHGDGRPGDDLRLTADSPARNAGVPLPDALTDPQRPTDGSRPDIGAMPYGSGPLHVGRHGRFTFPNEQTIAVLAAAQDAKAPQTPAEDHDDHEEHEDHEEQLNDEADAHLWSGLDDKSRWTDSTNWLDGHAPGVQTQGQVRFESGTSFTIKLDDQVHALGGMEITTFRSQPTFDLSGHTLTLAGDVRLGAPRLHTRFINGTLTLGTPAASANLRIQENQAANGQVTIGSAVRLNTANLDLLSIGDGSGNRGPQAVLELSDATLTNDTLHAESILVGQYNGLSSSGGKGTLLLPATTRKVQTDSLVVASNKRNAGSDDPAHVTGEIDLGGGEHLTLAVAQWFTLATGDHTEARLRNLPARLDILLGSADSPAGMRIAHKDLTQGSADDLAATAALPLPAGRVTAHLSELRVGHNTRKTGQAVGVLDLSNAELDVFMIHGIVVSPQYVDRQNMQNVPIYSNIVEMLEAPLLVQGALIVGLGVNASGQVTLPAGQASAGWAFIGNDADGSQGHLTLRGTDLTLRQGLTIGLGGQVTLHVTEVGGSITLTNDDATLDIAAGNGRAGVLHVIAASATASNKPVIRWQGNYAKALQAMLNTNSIRIQGGVVQIDEQDGWTVLRVR